MAPKGEAADKPEKKAKKSKNDGPKRGAFAVRRTRCDRVLARLLWWVSGPELTLA